MDFKGRAALVTGGTSGIGLAVAMGLLRGGARVIVVGRDANRGRDAVEAASGGDLGFVQGDLGVEADLGRVFAEAQERLGGNVDVLINSAGELRFGAVTDARTDDAMQMMLVNLMAPYVLIALAAPLMVERGWGRIVNVTTMATHGGIANIGIYSATKAALASYTQTCAAELAASGVNVNAVAPGPVPTPMGETMRAGQDMLAAALPARRKGTEEEIAAGVLFLASLEASYIHGTTLFVDGGWAAT